jgi:hypothetical protein
MMEAEFQAVKAILCDTTKLKPFDPSLKTELYTDATKLLGIGFILCQVGEDGCRNLI